MEKLALMVGAAVFGLTAGQAMAQMSPADQAFATKCPSGNILSPWNRLCFNPCGAIRRNRYDVDTQEPGPIRPQQAALPQ
jgi:hypothetical protein